MAQLQLRALRKKLQATYPTLPARKLLDGRSGSDISSVLSSGSSSSSNDAVAIRPFCGRVKRRILSTTDSDTSVHAVVKEQVQPQAGPSWRDPTPPVRRKIPRKVPTLSVPLRKSSRLSAKKPEPPLVSLVTSSEETISTRRSGTSHSTHKKRMKITEFTFTRERDTKIIMHAVTTCKARDNAVWRDFVCQNSDIFGSVSVKTLIARVQQLARGLASPHHKEYFKDELEIIGKMYAR